MSELNEPTFLAGDLYRRFRGLFEPYLEEARMDPTVLTNPDALVPLADHARFLNLVAERVGDDWLGLHLGLRVFPIDLGPIGYALMNSPSGKAALSTFSKYLAAYSRGCFFELKRESQDVYHYDFGYTVQGLGLIERRQEAECSLALVLNLVRTMTGMHYSPTRVLFEHPRPKDISEHRRIFGSPVEFGFSINRLMIGAEFLDKPVKSAETRLFGMIEEHLKRAVAAQDHATDFVTDISNLIARELSNGLQTIEWVACQMAMTKRTLQRRLNDHGVAFSDIVDKVRKDLALQYVQKSDISLTEVAFLLGYAHPSAFSRAFKIWTDATPSEMRNRSERS